MNPEQNPLPASAERPAGAELVHVAPELAPAKPEVVGAPERQEKEPSHASTNTTSLPPVVDPQGDLQANDQSQPQATTSLPDTAKDADRMEKEWAQKIRQILSDTKGNPSNKEEGIKALRADYLFKRYGRKIGDRN